MSQIVTWVVTATPPTPNGDLHVGHLSGPYLAADVFARGRRLFGENAVYVCYGDDNQSYVVTTAERLGVSPQELVSQSNADIANTLTSASIAMDAYTWPDEAHFAYVQQFFHSLHKAGKLVEREVEVFYDTARQRYLFESYIGGKCPVCLNSTKGSICEACGHPNDPAGLIDPYVVGDPEAQLELRTMRHLFLPIEDYRSQIADFYSGLGRRWRRHLPMLVDELLSAPRLADYPVTYHSDWGVPVGLPGWDGYVWNVWAEMLPGLVYAAGKAATPVLPEGAGNPWYQGNQGRLAQFLGFDNSYFFAIAHLALAFAADDCDGPKLIKPDYIITNEFYKFENFKFSTSQGHAIWGRDLLARVSSDAMRLYLALNNPETLQSNFVESEMRAVLEHRAIQPWEAFVDAFNSALTRIEDCQLPSDEPTWLQAVTQRFRLFQQPETFSLVASAELIVDLLPFLRERAERAQTPTDLGEIWLAVGGLSLLMAPLMPTISQELAAHTGLPQPSRWQAWRPTKTPRPLPAKLLTIAKQ